ncbi:restriction endonuclease [Paenibacillus sp. N3/727]|uniref:restriction endonuclease n=1 Tax=Paenibacillus sp. N3/727 TaxID=2925845 RepID=UPI001F539522|nr:restriction endonuclease [Paenibacillus sp. N3/727]UNK21024.1 restriction endonuclease [Paenibacillus sp. N3/727]
MFYKNEDDRVVFAECEKCGYEFKFVKYSGLLLSEGDTYKVSRSICCYNCKEESNIIINIEAKLKEKRESERILKEEKVEPGLKHFKQLQESEKTKVMLEDVTWFNEENKLQVGGWKCNLILDDNTLLFTLPINHCSYLDKRTVILNPDENYHVEVFDRETNNEVIIKKRSGEILLYLYTDRNKFREKNNQQADAIVRHIQVFNKLNSKTSEDIRNAYDVYGAEWPGKLYLDPLGLTIHWEDGSVFTTMDSVCTPFEIITTSQSPWSFIKYEIPVREDLLRFYIIQNGSTLVTFMLNIGKFNFDCFGVNLLIKEKIMNHFDQVNKTLREQFIDRIISNISCDPELQTLSLNFVKKYDKSLFFDINFIIEFEKQLIKEFGDLGDTLLYTSGRILDVENGYYLKVQDFLYNSFLMFSKLVHKRMKNSSQLESVFSSLFLLRRGAADYYYEEFGRDYKELITVVDQFSREEMVYLFSKDELSTDSKEEIAKLTYILLRHEKFSNDNFFDAYQWVSSHINTIRENKEIFDFENSLLELEQTKNKKEITIDDIDMMSGREFELFISDLFIKMGYTATATKSSGDQGIDVIAEKNAKRYGIQTKCYSGSISNKAIQEVSAGLKFYNLDKGIVITNNFYTESAIELAASNGMALFEFN